MSQLRSRARTFDPSMMDMPKNTKVAVRGGRGGGDEQDGGGGRAEEGGGGERNGEGEKGEGNGASN